MSKRVHLAELQLAIMQVLWDKVEATVAQVREALEPERTLAHTTIGTMLSKMEANKQVAHRSDGRVNIYRPLLKEDDVTRSMVTDLAERLFQGDVSRLMCSLLDGVDITPEELTQLKKLIREKEKEVRDGR